jgi:hypothetical protein
VVVGPVLPKALFGSPFKGITRTLFKGFNEHQAIGCSVHPVGEQMQMVRHETVSLKAKAVCLRFFNHEAQHLGHKPSILKPWHTVQSAAREEIPLRSDVAGAGEPNVFSPEFHRTRSL